MTRQKEPLYTAMPWSRRSVARVSGGVWFFEHVNQLEWLVGVFQPAS